MILLCCDGNDELWWIINFSTSCYCLLKTTENARLLFVQWWLVTKPETICFSTACKFSEEVWKSLTHKFLSLDYTTEWEEIIRLLTKQTRNKTWLFLLRYVFQATLSTIWKGGIKEDMVNYQIVLLLWFDALTK